MNYIWGGMLLVGIVYGTLTGEVGAVSESVISSVKEAVTLCLAMLGVMGFWAGLMEIAQDAGVLKRVSKAIRPVMRFLFPDIPAGHPALEHMTANCVANALGLGGASTVYGLKAMEALEELEEERRKEALTALPNQDQRMRPVLRGTASNEMCTFLILNISSLQLIPVNIIAFRSQYGSVNPTVIVGPAILATMASTATAVVFCKIADRKRKA